MTDSARRSISSVLEERARVAPDRTALVGNDGTGAYDSLTFRELRDLARRVAWWLAGEMGGRTVGRRVVWIFGTGNPLVAFALYHAVNEIGAVNVPVNPGSTAAEIGDIVVRTSAALVVAPASFRAASPRATPFLAIDRLDDLEAVARGAGTFVSSEEVSPGDPSVILFTSGTTGRSKGVVHSHASALAAGAGWKDAFALNDRDTYQSMFPVYAGAGLHFSGLACLLAGSTYVVDEARPTRDSLERIARHGATVYAAVPSVYHYWLAAMGDEHDLSSLRLLDFGGSVMHRGLIEALRARLPGVDLVQTYGLTEAGPGGLYLPAEFHEEKQGSIGCRPSGGLEFRVDAGAIEDGVRAEASGTTGELQLRGPSLMMGYLDDPEATEAVFDGEWMRTGDLVRVDPDGFVFFVDRLKDLIVRGGFNISTIEIEETFLRHPNVREAAVFGVPHDALGEVVAIALVADGELDLDDLHAFATQRLARVKVPAMLVVVDELPISTAGKVLKTALRRHPGLTDWVRA